MGFLLAELEEHLEVLLELRQLEQGGEV
jgi:hypothetical protein